MYELEIYVGDPYPPNFKESHREGWISYKEEEIRLNLTRIWQLSLKNYEDFLDEFIGIAIHEFLHYFMHINKMHQTEEIVEQLSHYLHILSIGHLIGAGTEETEQNKVNFHKWINHHFKDRALNGII